MATVEFNLLGAIEGHSAAEIQQILDHGFDVRTPIKGKTLVAHLTEMYTRSDQFVSCLRLLLERGAVLDDPRIGPVLLNDGDGRWARTGRSISPARKGEAIVVGMGDRFEVLAVNTLEGQSFIASPVIVDGDIYLRSRTHLFRIGEP